MNQLKLLKTKRFAPLFWTLFCGAFNDNFLKNALVILIIFKSTTIFGIGPAQMVAAASGIFILPFFLFSATAGQLADKFEKTKLIRIIKMAEIFIMIFASFGFLAERFELLMLALFLMGLHSTFFGPIKYSILPQHLAESELVGGNALVEAGSFLAILMGTIVGGVLINTSHGAAYVSIGLIIVAIAGFIACLKIPLAPSVDKSIELYLNPVTPTWEIFKFTKKNRSVFLSMLGISWFWFFGAAILTILPPYCKDVLRADASVVTFFIALFSVGIGIGSLLCESLSRGGLELGLVPLGSIGITIFTLDLFLVGSPDFFINDITVFQFLSEFAGIRIALDLLMLSVFSGFFTVPLYTMIQERSEKSHRSRIIAGNNILNAFFMVIASVMLMILFRLKLSIAEIFLILALLNGLVAIYIYLLLPEFLIRFFVWTIANIMYRLRIEGLENVPKTGAALLISNHVSFIDWMIIGAAVRRPVRFIMDHTYARGWVMRTLLRHAKVILIATKKENEALMNQAFEKAAQELQNGELVCIFPEGQITRNGEMNAFRPGVEKLLKMAPAPVIPMAINGLWGSIFSREGGRALNHFPRKAWARVNLAIGQPIIANSEEATAPMLFEKVAALYKSEK
jgi:1-acyl-sn-glycerol-3-phosphate acyltransferase